MRISFISSFRDLTYYYYLKQPRQMCEIRLNQILAKNRRLRNRANRYSSYQFISKYTNQEILFVNEGN